MELWDLMVNVIMEPKLFIEEDIGPSYRYSLGNRSTFLWKGSHREITSVLIRLFNSTLRNT